MRYIRLKSLTWWAGFAAVLLGAWDAFAPSQGTGILAEVLGALLGATDAAPATLIVLGLGLIGIRDKLERDR